jgi:cellulose synthase/poly-beta-1,6-N-acetylglucosamine synthase-like glycosyltransferase
MPRIPFQFAYQDLSRGVQADWTHFYTSNLSLKTKILRENTFDESFTKAAAEDLELGYRLECEHGLTVIFVPDALAFNLHPSSFPQACRRMINVGRSIRRFHELWPEDWPPSFLRRMRREFMPRNQWLLPPISAIANAATKILAPKLYYAWSLILIIFMLGISDTPPQAGSTIG